MSILVKNDALDWTRSLVQARLLSEIFSDRVKGFVLKGGMAMKVRHAQARSTQDIDLDSLGDLPLHEMQKLMRRAITRALSDNFLEDVEIKEPKQTDTTARWRIRGTDKKTKESLVLTIEVSRRDQVKDEEFDERPFMFQGVDAPVLVYTNKSLAFKKIKALLSPSREAPRDVSDLFLLIKGHVEPPTEDLKEYLKENSIQDLTRLLWQKIDSMDFNRFKTEVMPSLPASSQAKEWYASWDDVRLTVGQKIEEWLVKAQQELQQQEALTPSEDPSVESPSVEKITVEKIKKSHQDHFPIPKEQAPKGEARGLN